MRITGDYRQWQVTATMLAKILGLTKGRVSQLRTAGVILGDDSGVFLIESLKKYYLQKADAPEVNYNLEKALYMRAKRELAELKLSKARGELYEAAAVEDAFLNILTALRTNLQGLPTKLAGQLVSKSSADISYILTLEIGQLLEELSQFDIGSLASEVEDDESD